MSRRFIGVAAPVAAALVVLAMTVEAQPTGARRTGPGAGSGNDAGGIDGGVDGDDGGGDGGGGNAGSDSCKFEYNETALKRAYTDLQATSKSLPKTEVLQTHYDREGDKFYLVVGPDGKQWGVTPSAIREDAELYVISYSASTAPQTIAASGCDRLQTRVLGQAVPIPRANVEAPEVTYSATLYSLGRCNADKAVSIQVKSQACGDTTISLKTAPVYHLTVGYGAVYYSGSTTEVGVDINAGGMPNTAFSREASRGFQDRVLFGWFPAGFSPDTPLRERVGSSLFAATLIDPSRPLSSLNLALGFEPTTGLALIAGVQFCEEQKQLGGGLVNGAVFTDDSTKLPTTESWTCGLAQAGYIGVSATIDLLGKLISR